MTRIRGETPMATWHSDPSERSTRFGNAIRLRRKDCLGANGRHITQADFAAHLERSPSWIKLLESGRIDPEDLPNSVHLKVRDFVGWSSEAYFAATGFALGEALESVEPTPGLRQVRLPILNTAPEEVLLGLRELEDHRASDLVAFRDFDAGTVVWVSRKFKYDVGDLIGVTYPDGQPHLRRLTGFRRPGFGQREMPVLAFPDRLEFFETMPKKAAIIGKVIAVLKLL